MDRFILYRPSDIRIFSSACGINAKRKNTVLSGEFLATQAQREVVKIFFFPTGLEVHLEDMF
jgi:hypothetical protein